MAILNQLTLSGDGTIDTTNIIDSDVDGTYFDDCNDAPDGVSTDYVEHNSALADGTYEMWYPLTNVNANFGGMLTFNIDVDVELIGSVTNDLVDLTVRIFDADNDTGNPLTDESATLGDETDTTRVQRNVSLTNFAGNKTQWDGAHARFSYAYDRVSGPDAFTLRLYGTDFDGTYEIAGGVTVPVLDEGMLAGGLQQLSGGLE